MHKMVQHDINNFHHISFHFNLYGNSHILQMNVNLQYVEAKLVRITSLVLMSTLNASVAFGSPS